MSQYNYWLKCDVTPGIFPGEYTVETKTLDGNTISMFASDAYVKAGEGLLRVDILEESPNAILIFLPVAPFETFSRSVNVSPQAVLRH